MALNFRPEPQTVVVDTSGLFTPGFVELRQGTIVSYANPLPLALGPYGYRFLQVIPPSESLPLDGAYPEAAEGAG